MKEHFVRLMSKEKECKRCFQVGDRQEILPRNTSLFETLINQKEGVMKKVLCVDDDSSLLQLYHDELSEEGYEVILAKDGQEALMKFEKDIPDVVVMDIRMPRMDGIHTMTTFLGKDRGIQIILNTAHALYRDNFMTWGATAFVIKSSDLSELKQKIREALKNREKLRKT